MQSRVHGPARVLSEPKVLQTNALAWIAAPQNVITIKSKARELQTKDSGASSGERAWGSGGSELRQDGKAARHGSLASRNPNKVEPNPAIAAAEPAQAHAYEKSKFLMRNHSDADAIHDLSTC
jgi:hypothetical protein